MRSTIKIKATKIREHDRAYMKVKADCITSNGCLHHRGFPNFFALFTVA